jgi:hypothetical protein
MRKCLDLRDVRVMTVLPSGVEGKMSLCSGERVLSTYRLTGGILGSDAKAWVLYEGGKKIRTLKPGSDTIRLAPSKTTTYRVSTEGGAERFYSFTIKVTEPPRLPKGLKGGDMVCPGEVFQIEAIGDVPDADTKWYWYRTLSGELSPKLIGEGSSIRDSIRFGAVYALMAEKGECTLRLDGKFSVAVYKSPPIPTLSVKYIGKGHKRADVRLTGPISNEIIYDWKVDQSSSTAHTGQTWEGVSIPKNGLSLSVRAINKCGISSLPSIQYLNRSAPSLSRTTVRFLNLGIATENLSRLGNVRMVIGSSRFWGSVIFNPMQVLGYPAYKKSIAGRNLDIDDAGLVTNFPPAIGSYYEVNGTAMSVRSGILLGTMFGKGKIRAFTGVGFGTRSLKWGLDVRPYNSTAIQKVWANNMSGSWSGAAIEGGVFIDLVGVNLMLGMQSVIDPSRPSPYVEATAGLGIRLKKSSR